MTYPLKRKLSIWGYSLLIFCTLHHALAGHVIHGRYTSAPPIVGDKVLKDFFINKLVSGNTGDFYLNLDNGHSVLNLKKFPQLGTALSENLLSSGEEYSSYKHVIVGNASLGTLTDSRGRGVRGSLINNYYTRYPGYSMDKLYANYRNNVVLMYPAVGCYEPGVNGQPGYGDYFTANTAYVLGSVGYSGTDKAFLRAWIHALASLTPQVKAKLKEEGLLMPTLQVIFRLSNNNILSRDEYLTGKAHPPAFYGCHIDILKMGKIAATMTGDVVPPIVQLKVLEEDMPIPGIEFFDPRFTNDTIFDTPGAIARTFRSYKHEKRMVVSAEYSYDVNNHQLSYHWVVLRGDKDKIKIIPKNDENSIVEIKVPYFEKYLDPDYHVYTNRVEIGAFVRNKAYYSAPGFITFLSFPNEARTYDKTGQIIDIGYNVGDTDMSYNTELKGHHLRVFSSGYVIKDWQALFNFVLNGDRETLASKLLRSQLDKVHYIAIADCAAEINPCFERISNAKNDPELEKKILKEAREDAYAILTKKRINDEMSVRQLLEKILNNIKNNVKLYVENQERINNLVESSKNNNARLKFLRTRENLVKLGILKEIDGLFSIQSVRNLTSPIEHHLTQYERNQLEWFNIGMMNTLLYPQFMNKKFKVNATDVRLSAPKSWFRDIFHRDKKGNFSGWSRYDKNGISHYNREGILANGKTVSYKVERRPSSKQNNWYDIQVIPVSY